MEKSKKIIDSSVAVTIGSRADEHWQKQGFADMLPFVRPKLSLPKSLAEYSSMEVLKGRFSLKDIGFGNWVTNEDRYNYLNSLIVCCYDLNKVVGFQYNIGFGQLSIAFGARGKGRAEAHYEPFYKIINITRYQDNEDPRIVRFVSTGGMGSFAHEYGHFLDYYAGEYLDKSSKIFAVTGGNTTDVERIGVSGEIRQTVDDILEKVIWADYKKKKFSAYYNRLFALVSKREDMGEYFLRRNEMFARWFEAWVSYELRKQNIKNLLLAEPKYDIGIYPTDNEIEKVSPLFKRFCRLVKQGVQN